MPRMKKLLMVLGVGILVAGGVQAHDLNNATGTSGLIMIDKIGKIVRFFEPATMKEISTLTIDGTPHELAISADRKTAYIPDYGDGVYGRNPNPGHAIAIVDLASRRVTGTIDVSPYQAPHGLQVDAPGLLYAVCDLSRKLLVIDPAKRTIVAAIDTEGTSHWVAVLPDGSKAYTANKNDRQFVSVIDLKTRKMVGKVTMPKGTQGITASADGKRVLAMDMADARIAVIDTAKDSVVDEIALEGTTKGAWGARYSPDGMHLLIISVNDGTATLVPAANLHAKQTVLKVGSQPFGIAFTADSTRALVSNHGDGTISVIDLAKAQVVNSFTAGKGIETLSFY